MVIKQAGTWLMYWQQTDGHDRLLEGQLEKTDVNTIKLAAAILMACSCNHFQDTAHLYCKHGRQLLVLLLTNSNKNSFKIYTPAVALNLWFKL
jgi:hypothetical protein